MRTSIWIVAATLLAGCSSAARARGIAPQASVDRGIELYNNRDFQGAERVLEEATDSFPRDARAFTYLGLSRLELKEHPQAEEAFRKAIAIDGNHAQAHYGLGLALGYQDQLDQAIAELQKASELDPQNAYAHYHLGLALHRKGVKDRALLHLHRFLELKPDAPEAARVKALLSQLQ